MQSDHKSSFWSRCFGGVSPQDRRNQRWMLWSNLGWAISFVAVSMALSRGWLEGPIAWVSTAVPVTLSLVVLVVFTRFLRQTDELQRQIQLQALALGFGGSLFGIFAWAIFERLGAPSLEASELSMVMVGLYLLGIFIGWSRYR